MDNIFTLKNLVRACAQAWFDLLPLGVLLSAAGLTAIAWWGRYVALAVVAAVLIGAAIPSIRDGYPRWTRRLFGDVNLPPPERLRSAETHWLIVWLLVCLAGTAVFFALYVALLDGVHVLAALLAPKTPVLRPVVLMLIVAIGLPVLGVIIRCAELATYWVHLRTQGPRND